MENWREEAAAIKARLAVQHLAPKALVQSHPDPARLLDAWRSLLAEEWTEELERHRSACLAGTEQA